MRYVYSIEKVMKQENIKDYLELSLKIQDLCVKYSNKGPMKKFGEKGHNTVINALKRYFEYLLNATDYKPVLKRYFV